MSTVFGNTFKNQSRMSLLTEWSFESEITGKLVRNYLEIACNTIALCVETGVKK
jgi:hypothetical protein